MTLQKLKEQVLRGSHISKEEAEWLLLCCYMKTNDRNKALQWVEKIKNNNGIYVKKTTFIEQLLKEKKYCYYSEVFYFYVSPIMCMPK